MQLSITKPPTNVIWFHTTWLLHFFFYKHTLLRICVMSPQPFFCGAWSRKTCSGFEMRKKKDWKIPEHKCLVWCIVTTAAEQNKGTAPHLSQLQNYTGFYMHWHLRFSTKQVTFSCFYYVLMLSNGEGGRGRNMLPLEWGSGLPLRLQ